MMAVKKVSNILEADLPIAQQSGEPSVGLPLPRDSETELKPERPLVSHLYRRSVAVALRFRSTSVHAA